MRLFLVVSMVLVGLKNEVYYMQHVLALLHAKC